MVDVLRNLRPEAQELIDYREWSIKTAEGVQMFTALGGRVIPTLCVDGEKRFESVIPTMDEIYTALIEAARGLEQAVVLRESYERAKVDYEESCPS
jgi:hypothetical protein